MNRVPMFSVLALLSNFGSAHAQDGECSDGLCGTPQDHGGGDANSSVLIQGGDLGDTYQYADDLDGDGIEDSYDNCPFKPNADQFDGDSDKFGDACDFCPEIFETQMLDIDDDGIGDSCDEDADGDRVANETDNCRLISNASQLDTDDDSLGNACDDDDDDDGFEDLLDRCPLVATAQNAFDEIDIRKCDSDLDGDGILNTLDNCMEIGNDDQENTDGDRLGDDCDSDLDGDGILNAIDNCERVSNTDQKDGDRDQLGDACDSQFCYVVDRNNPATCLNPNAPLTVYAGGTMVARTGEAIALRIHANREGATLNYAWVVVESPNDSEALPTYPKGTLTYAMNFGYRYQKNAVATFTPDTPGTYTILLVVESVTPDPAGRNKTSTALVVQASGAPANGGCATAPIRESGTSGLVIAFLVFIIFLWLRP